MAVVQNATRLHENCFKTFCITLLTRKIKAKSMSLAEATNYMDLNDIENCKIYT